MFNVQCPGCAAPYQVNERRVPAAGLRMRCPKCATSFLVEKPMTAEMSPEANPAPRAPVRGAGQVRPPNAFKGTMIGVPEPAQMRPDLRMGKQANVQPGASASAGAGDSPKIEPPLRRRLARPLRLNPTCPQP